MDALSHPPLASTMSPWQQNLYTIFKSFSSTMIPAAGLSFIGLLLLCISHIGSLACLLNFHCSSNNNAAIGWCPGGGLLSSHEVTVMNGEGVKHGNSPNGRFRVRWLQELGLRIHVQSVWFRLKHNRQLKELDSSLLNSVITQRSIYKIYSALCMLC